MGKDPCHLCATPGVKYVQGYADCAGCGSIPIRALIAFRSEGHLTEIDFDKATSTYERSPFATRLSFGEWLIKFNLRLVARP